MIHRLLVLTAFVCCGLVLASFTLFTRDQLAGASRHQQNQLVASAPAKPQPRPKPAPAGQPRRFIDAAAGSLRSPFVSIVQSHSLWVRRGLPTIFALLVYGVGLGYLARYSRGMR